MGAYVKSVTHSRFGRLHLEVALDLVGHRLCLSRVTRLREQQTPCSRNSAWIRGAP